MEQREVQQLYRDFLHSYDEEKTRIWDEKSKEFRDFWNNKIAGNDVREISESEIDQIIRILDNRAKGNTKGSTAVARIMVPQGAWRRMFHEFKTNEEIRNILTDILNENQETIQIQLIDKLYKANEGRKNHLTGPSANVINAMLFAYNPSKHVSAVSLNDREKIIEYFKFPNGPDFKKYAIGKKVVLSNKAIIDGFKMFQISSHPRTISRFLYTTLLDYWKKPEAETVKIKGKEVTVSIPDEEREVSGEAPTSEKRDSIQVQAKIAGIGETLGFKIWLPSSDRTRVTQIWKPKGDSLLEVLPLAFDDQVLRIIKNIDVLWIRGHEIVRAFEVEDKTSIYSGILRMGDLLALHPNLKIRIHLVSPSERRDEVFRQINRPVFASVGGHRLSNVCSYLSYDSVQEIASEKNLKNMKETIIDEYIESPTEFLGNE